LINKSLIFNRKCGALIIYVGIGRAKLNVISQPIIYVDLESSCLL